MRRALAITAAIAAISIGAPASAQAYQCRAPSNIGPLPMVRLDGPPRRAVISGYTLAASWSPEYCRNDRDPASMQCSGRDGRFGFVLHGLWPESRSGPSPQWCATAPMPSPELVRRNLCQTPAPWLIMHEWAKHGTCMARRPEDYLRVSTILWRSIAWPDADRLSRKQGLTAGNLRLAFTQANPDWQPSQVGILTSRTGWLREIHLCYGRDFMPATCDRRSLGARDAEPLRIWRGF